MLKRLHARIEKLCAYDHCRVPLPWFAWSNRTDEVSRLHRTILALDSGEPSPGAATVIAAALVHFVRGTRDVILTWRRMRRACREGYGIGCIRQFGGLLLATFRYNHPAMLYYALRLFRLEHRRWAAVFSHGETTLLLARFEKRSEATGLWTKQGWAAFCARHGIPSPPIAASAIAQGIEIFRPDLLQPGRDLFVKPDKDYSSRGGILLEWHAPAGAWEALGAASGRVTPAGLPDFLQAQAGTGRHVVQTRLRNAPDIADMASRALVNARIVTLHRPDRGIGILMAGLRLPPGDQPTSDVLGSTLVAPIALDTGGLGDAECGLLHLGSCPRHPFNGAPLRGRILSQWPQMRDLALAAHAKVPFAPSIGWDLIATTDGVFILEANAVWHAYLAQHWGLSPLGETDWPSCMLQALDQPPPIPEAPK